MKTMFVSYNALSEPLVQSQVVPYLEGLSKRGVKCFLLTFEKKKKGADKIKKRLKSCGIKWYTLKYHKTPTLPATIFDIFTGILLGLCITLSNNIDIVHCRGTVPAVMGYVISRLTGRKFLFDVRGLMAEEYVDGGIWEKGGLLYRLTSWIEKNLFKNADGIVVLTEDIKEYLASVNETKIKEINVIPCCVDTDSFSKKSLVNESLEEKYQITGKFVFIYTGSIGTWYMLDEMIDFFQTAKAVIKNSHFLILTHLDKDVVRRTVREKNLESGDVTIDSVEFDRIPDYIKIANAGIFFIKPCFSKRSSCPIKFAEYLTCGLPVIINSGIGDTDRIVEKYNIGVVIQQFNKQAYLEALEKLSYLIKDRDSLFKRSRKVAEELFSLEKGVDKYLHIYRRLGCN